MSNDNCWKCRTIHPDGAETCEEARAARISNLLEQTKRGLEAIPRCPHKVPRSVVCRKCTPLPTQEAK